MTQIRQMALFLALCLAPALAAPAAAQDSATAQQSTPAQQPAATPDAVAQEDRPQAPAERFYVNLGGGVQVKSQTISEAGTFDIYDEAASFTLERKLKSGGLVDVGGGLRFMRRFGAGVSYTYRVKTTDDLAANVSVPHPIFAGEPRTATVRLGGLGYSEQAVHIQAVWFRPVTTQFDIAVFAGPSVFIVDLDQASFGPANVQEGAFPFSTVTIAGVAASGRSETAVGFHAGVDGTYLFTRRFGGGLFLRYSRASVDFPTSAGGTVGVDAGGFEVGGGLRVRF